MSPPLLLEDPAYFDRLAEVDASHWWSAGMWRIASHWLDRALRGRVGLVALDVGCGAGGTLKRLASRPEISRVFGLDPSEAALRHAARCGRASLLRGSAETLPFSADSFDLATCFDVFQHLDPGGDRRAADEMSRVLRPGGFLVVRANGRGMRPRPSAGPGPYRLGRLIGIFEETGFRVASATYANCLPSVGAEIAGWAMRARRRGTLASLGHPSGGGLRIRPTSPARNRLMGAVATIEAYTAGRLGIRLPAGHSTMMLAEKAR